METFYGIDSIVNLYGVSYTPRYFAICPDRSMKGFNYGAEENIFIFIDNCGATTSILNNKNNILAKYFANKLFLVSKTDDNILISINNSLGQQIDIIKYKLLKGKNSIDLDIDKGFYIINIYSYKTNYVNSIKIIVQ